MSQGLINRTYAARQEAVLRSRLAWVRTVPTLTGARTWWLAAALLRPCVHASAPITGFSPEVDVYSALTPNTQFWFQSQTYGAE